MGKSQHSVSAMASLSVLLLTVTAYTKACLQLGAHDISLALCEHDVCTISIATTMKRRYWDFQIMQCTCCHVPCLDIYAPQQ